MARTEVTAIDMNVCQDVQLLAHSQSGVLFEWSGIAVFISVAYPYFLICVFVQFRFAVFISLIFRVEKYCFFLSLIHHPFFRLLWRLLCINSSWFHIYFHFIIPASHFYISLLIPSPNSLFYVCISLHSVPSFILSRARHCRLDWNQPCVPFIHARSDPLYPLPTYTCKFDRQTHPYKLEMSAHKSLKCISCNNKVKICWLLDRALFCSLAELDTISM